MSATVLGPCPGCETWTCEIAAGAAASVARQAIRRHMDACPPLRALADSRGVTFNGVPVKPGERD